MKPIVTAGEMAEMDRYTIEHIGIPGVVLMENAGVGIVQSALKILGNADGQVIHIFCGPGNNGGDGFVVARHLINSGAHVKTFILTDRDKIKGDAKINLDILQKMSSEIEFIEQVPSGPLERPDLIIDAILGTGVKGALRGLFAEIVDYINKIPIPKLAVDIPTGINADTGAIDGLAVRASRTATMALLKRGLLFSPARDFAGEIDIVDISMPDSVLKEKNLKSFLVEKQDVAKLLPVRSRETHKNRCGTVAIIGGSTGFTGAACLTAEATLRAGAGLAYLTIPASLNPVFETKLTEVITWPFDDAGEGYLHRDSLQEILSRVKSQTVAAIGPGLGLHDKTIDLVFELLKELDRPLVLDADGLNIVARKTELIKNYKGEMVLTPHPGELSRLTGLSTKEIAADRLNIAQRFADEWEKVLVLKGGPTVIALPDGSVYINSTGNAGLATAGTGDVLTGTIAGLMAQGLTAANAAIAGVYVHGYAGDLARQELGEMGMIAGDVLHRLPHALQKLKELL